MSEKKQSEQMAISERQEFVQIRQHYIDSAHRSSNVFDSTMITLTTAAIWVSLFMLDKKMSDVSFLYFLIRSRVLLWVTLLLILFSFIISEKAHRLSIDLHDMQYIKNDSNKKQEEKIECKIKTMNQILSLMKHIQIITLVCGIVFLVLFLLKNIKWI
jgi:hypothetical protein